MQKEGKNIEQDNKLYYFNKELHDLADPASKDTLVINNLKGAFLGFAFGKAYKTHASILILSDAGCGQDATILARSLFELAATVLYILNDPTDNRIKRFMDFDWVMRKRLYDYLESQPELNTKLQKDAEEKGVSTEKIIQKAKKAQEEHKYNLRIGWSDKNIKDMAEEVGLGDLYPTAYHLYSNLHHSAVRTINDYFNVGEDGAIEIDSGPSSNWVGQSLVGAFQFFGIIFEKWDEYFKLGLNGKLKELTDKYIEEIHGVTHKS